MKEKDHTRMTFIIATTLAMIATAIQARQLSFAESVDRLQCNSSAAKGVRMSPMTLVHTMCKEGRNTIYIASKTSGDGILVLSADDCAPVLLGYTDNGTCTSYEELPDAMRWWLSLYSDNIARTMTTGGTIETTAIDHTAIAPMLTTVWAQGSPYNKLCNDVEEGAQTGCVATAMAQIMKFHGYPTKGLLDHSYSYKVSDPTETDRFHTRTITISSDISSHAYEWSSMRDSYGYFGNDENEEDAVALLMRDCGVAVHMKYGAYASAAANAMVPYALSTFFGYDKGMQNVYRDTQTDTEWEQMLINELAAGRPVFYSGTSIKYGGHAFVCDGYDGNGRFHFNWGWNGGCDGYFIVTGANALNAYGNTIDNQAFSKAQMITIGIQPECGGTLPPAIFSMDQGFTIKETNSSTASENINMDTSYPYFYYACSYLVNRSTRPIKATFGFKLKNKRNSFIATPYYSHGYATYSLEDYMMPEGWLNAGSVNVNGTYQVIPVFKDEQDEAAGWQEIQLPADFTPPTITVTGGSEPTSIDYPLQDAVAYEIQEDLFCDHIYYSRYFQSTKFQALYIPFSMEYADWKDHADIYGITRFTGTDGNYSVLLTKLADGDVTEANRPYIIRPKTTGEFYITLTDAMLRPSTDNSLVIECEDYDLIFTGTHAGTTIQADTYFAIGNGELHYTQEPHDLSPGRWFVAIKDKSGKPVTPTSFLSCSKAKSLRFTIDGDSLPTTVSDIRTRHESTGTIHSITGQRLTVPLKGVNVIDGIKAILR